MSKRRVVWFAPNAGNWVTYRMEHRVANAIADSGDSVLMIQCDKVLDAYCQVMAPAGLVATSSTSDKQAVCRNCRYAAGLARRSAHYETSQLSEYISASDRTWVEEVLTATTSDNWSDIVVDGLPVGRYAAYTTMLHHKRATVSDTPEAWQEYLSDLRGALLVARALPTLIARSEPTHALVYNALYPANRVFAEGLKGAGARIVNLSGGPAAPRRYNTLALYDGIRASQTMADSTSFRQSLDVPASPLEILLVEEHMRHLMSAADPWVYSAAASRRPAYETRQQLAIRAHAPVVTVIVSSPDETRSSLMVDAEYERDPENGFSDVTEFLQATIGLAGSRPDVDFVFRLHPRLAPNKREGLLSPDLQPMYDLLASLPDNAVINGPEDGLSLYDLLLISDAAVNQSSSAGLEFQLFGVPVVQYDAVRQNAYPPEAELIANRDHESLADALERGLRSGFAMQRVIRSFRWYASMQVRAVVHLDPPDMPDARPGSALGTAHPPVTRHPLGRFLPLRLKKYLAAQIQRRQWKSDLATQGPLEVEAAAVLDAQLSAVRGDGDVWEPSMSYPEGSDALSEELAVSDALGRLSSHLALGDLDGVGVVAVLSRRSPSGRA